MLQVAKEDTVNCSVTNPKNGINPDSSPRALHSKINVVIDLTSHTTDTTGKEHQQKMEREHGLNILASSGRK